MIYKGGYAFYGQTIGIIVLDTKFPRIPGDVGNATSFKFPVRYKVVKGVTAEKILQKLDLTILGDLIEAAKELEQEGVKAITTTCGLLAIFQKEIASAVKVPVFSSSLLQVPIVYKMFDPTKKVGIITTNSKKINKNMLEAVNASNIPVYIIGMEDQYEFTYMRKKMNQFDPNKVRYEIVNKAKELISHEPEVASIVLECTNMAPYSKYIADAIKLPVFDIITLINWVYSALLQNEYKGYF